MDDPNNAVVYAFMIVMVAVGLIFLYLCFKD